MVSGAPGFCNSSCSWSCLLLLLIFCSWSCFIGTLPQSNIIRSKFESHPLLYMYGDGGTQHVWSLSLVTVVCSTLQSGIRIWRGGFLQEWGHLVVFFLVDLSKIKRIIRSPSKGSKLWQFVLYKSIAVSHFNNISIYGISELSSPRWCLACWRPPRGRGRRGSGNAASLPFGNLK